MCSPAYTGAVRGRCATGAYRRAPSIQGKYGCRPYTRLVVTKTNLNSRARRLRVYLVEDSTIMVGLLRDPQWARRLADSGLHRVAELLDPKRNLELMAAAFADPAAFNSKIKVLFLSVGSVEGPGTKAFSDALNQAGVHTVYFESPGTAHEWLSWRRAFDDFAPRLFK